MSRRGSAQQDPGARHPGPRRPRCEPPVVWTGITVDDGRRCARCTRRSIRRCCCSPSPAISIDQVVLGAARRRRRHPARRPLAALGDAGRLGGLYIEQRTADVALLDGAVRRSSCAAPSRSPGLTGEVVPLDATGGLAGTFVMVAGLSGSWCYDVTTLRRRPRGHRRLHRGAQDAGADANSRPASRTAWAGTTLGRGHDRAAGGAAAGPVDLPGAAPTTRTSAARRSGSSASAIAGVGADERDGARRRSCSRRRWCATRDQPAERARPARSPSCRTSAARPRAGTGTPRPRRCGTSTTRTTAATPFRPRRPPPPQLLRARVRHAQRVADLARRLRPRGRRERVWRLRPSARTTRTRRRRRHAVDATAGGPVAVEPGGRAAAAHRRAARRTSRRSGSARSPTATWRTIPPRMPTRRTRPRPCVAPSAPTSRRPCASSRSTRRCRRRRARRAEPDELPDDGAPEPRQQPDPGRPTTSPTPGRSQGVLNAETRGLLKMWVERDWHCPVVVEARVLEPVDAPRRCCATPTSGGRQGGAGHQRRDRRRASEPLAAHPAGEPGRTRSSCGTSRDHYPQAAGPAAAASRS